MYFEIPELMWQKNWDETLNIGYKCRIKTLYTRSMHIDFGHSNNF